MLGLPTCGFGSRGSKGVVMRARIVALTSVELEIFGNLKWRIESVGAK